MTTVHDLRRRGITIAGGIGVALTFATVILMLAGAPVFETYGQLIAGSLGSADRIAQVINGWIPLTLCAIGLLYTFRIGLWNIGIEGQVMMGAVFATAVMRWGTPWPPELTLTAAFAAAALGGGLWAVAAGFLKTRGGVHEIFAGLGLNFVAQGIILWLIFGPWKRPGIASMSGTEVFPDHLWLSVIRGFRVPPAGLALAVCGFLGTALALRYSRIGLNLKAIGGNPAAAVRFRLRPRQTMLIAMLFAGAFAGLAGAIQVAGVYHRLIPAISSNYGYLALLVVMLADYGVWATPAVAFFFAGLNVGSIQLPMVLQIDSSLCGVIQGALVLAFLAVHGWRQRVRMHR